MPEIWNNLVSDLLLKNHVFRLVFESNKFILSKNEICIKKGYMNTSIRG